MSRRNPHLTVFIALIVLTMLHLDSGQYLRRFSAKDFNVVRIETKCEEYCWLNKMCDFYMFIQNNPSQKRARPICRIYSNKGKR